MKRKITLSALSLAVVFIANSCAPTTPTTRIEKNPAVFESLPSSHKELVQQGEIKKGMHKDAVLLAWGKPSGQTSGNRNGKSFEKWIYTRAVPTYRHSFHPYASYGYGRYGCRRGGYRSNYGLSFGPEVYYIQRTAATVEFDHYSRVSEWVTRR